MSCASFLSLQILILISLLALEDNDGTFLSYVNKSPCPVNSHTVCVSCFLLASEAFLLCNLAF